MPNDIIKRDEEPVALTTSEQPTVMEIIHHMARDPRVDVQKLQDLLAMQERLEARQARMAFAEAMRACQNELRPIVRDAENKSNHSKYARLETINRQIAPVITKHGFSVTYGTAEPKDPKAVRVVAKLHHIAGHTESYELEAALDMTGAQGSANKTAVQGLGSSVSYLRRYLLLMIFNLTLINEDNDGRGAFISDQQAQALVGLLAQCYINPKEAPAIERGFLDYMGAKAVGEIHAIDFQKAVNILESKKRLLAQKAAEVPEVKELPDAVDQVAGKRLRCKGKTWEVIDTEDGHRWKEVK